MKTSLLIAFFACALSSEVCRADSLNAQTEKEIRRELCRLEMATKQIAPSEQKKFKKGCAAELNLAGWLGEFFYDPNFYPEGFNNALLDPPAHRLTAIKVKQGESPISDIGLCC